MGESYECWRPCTGDGAEGCGGGWSIDLYLVDGDKYLPAAPPAAPLPACPQVPGYTFQRFTDQFGGDIIQTGSNLADMAKVRGDGGRSMCGVKLTLLGFSSNARPHT